MAAAVAAVADVDVDEPEVVAGVPPRDLNAQKSSSWKIILTYTLKSAKTASGLKEKRPISS